MRKINLGNGFECEVIKTLPDELGRNLEGHLYYLGEMLDGYESESNFISESELIKHMANDVLPEYIKSAGKKAYSIKYFKEQNAVYDFVKMYIMDNKIYWGNTLDVIEILEDSGYFMPKHGDIGFSVDEFNAYRRIVNDISLEFLKHLKSFGFGADRNNSDRKGHPHKEKHANCKNLVYTRYPWTSGNRIIKSVKTILSITGRDFLIGQDISKFKKNDPAAYEFMKALISHLKDINVELNNIVSETGFRKAAMEFVEYMSENGNSLHENYQKMSPKGYGKYK